MKFVIVDFAEIVGNIPNKITVGFLVMTRLIRLPNKERVTINEGDVLLNNNSVSYLITRNWDEIKVT